MLITTRIFAAALVAASTLPACYVGWAQPFEPAELRRGKSWVAAPHVPLVKMRSLTDCGAAALAMVLGHWKLPVSVDDVVRALPVPKGRGIPAGKLRDFAKQRGLNAFLFHGRLQDLYRELQKKRPVLVGLKKPVMVASLAHYEVVVAINREKRIVVTLDPAHGWRQNSFRRFLEEWEAAARLTLVTFARPKKAGEKAAIDRKPAGERPLKGTSR